MRLGKEGHPLRTPHIFTTARTGSIPIPTSEEARQTNAGEYAPGRIQKFIQRLAGRWETKATVAATTALGITAAYHYIPSIHRAIDTVGTQTRLLLNPTDEKIRVSPTGIPNFAPSIPGENITPETTGKSPQELMAEAGYKILWIDPSDNIGRTVFYDHKGGWGGGIGAIYSEGKGTDGKTYRALTYVTGQFVAFEEIEESPDKYILLKHPQTQEPLPKIRIASDNKINSTEGMQPTTLSVINLSLNDETARSLGTTGRLGFFPQWSIEELSKILQPGDAVGAGVGGVKGISIYEQKEENGVVTANYYPYFAGGITIKRLGGKAQIELELAQ